MIGSTCSSLRPVVLEPYEPADDADGYPEKNLPKKSPDYYKSREVKYLNICVSHNGF